MDPAESRLEGLGVSQQATDWHPTTNPSGAAGPAREHGRLVPRQIRAKAHGQGRASDDADRRQEQAGPGPKQEDEAGGSSTEHPRGFGEAKEATGPEPAAGDRSRPR